MSIIKRTGAVLPRAFSVQPSAQFEIFDGNWSTFNIQVGGGPSESQNFRATVSTSSFSIWLPEPGNCTNSSASFSSSDCAATRGVGFYEGAQSLGYDGSRSNTSRALDLVNMDIGGQLDPGTLFGSEYLATGMLWVDYLYMSSGTGSSTVNSSDQVPIYGYRDIEYYLPTFGIGYGAVEDTGSNVTTNSTLLSMATAGVIPSQSWGYTAGAYYRE
jgi:hypothetical protein